MHTSTMNTSSVRKLRDPLHRMLRLNVHRSVILTFFIQFVIVSATNGQSLEYWKKKTLDEYPALKDTSSPMSQKYQQLRETKKSDPRYFENPKWPYLLAVEALQHKDNPAEEAPSIPHTATMSGMTFHASWMPTRLDTKKIYAENLEFFCLQVIDGKRDAPEVVPAEIWNGVTWLMPLRVALEKLPKGARKHKAIPMQNLVFPQDSLFLHTYALDGRMQFNDRGSPFKYLTFMTDLRGHVVSLQLVNEKPPGVVWEPNLPVVIKNPYYNYLQERFKGKESYSVPTQVLTAGKGVKLVKSAFCHGYFNVEQNRPGGFTQYASPYAGYEYSEDVHWYLTDPLARKILHIIQTHRKAGRLK
jgi:hypothetical protein